MALKNQDVLQADVIQGDASFFRQQYFLLVDRRFTLDQVLNPEWWRLQTKLRVNDEITLLAEDGSFDILARVVQADRGRLLRPSFASRMVPGRSRRPIRRHRRSSGCFDSANRLECGFSFWCPFSPVRHRR